MNTQIMTIYRKSISEAMLLAVAFGPWRSIRIDMGATHDSKLL
jgi:hypothetical protein